MGVVEGPTRRRDVYNDVRRQLERQALLARAGEELAAAVEAYLAAAPADEPRTVLASALEKFRTAAAS